LKKDEKIEVRLIIHTIAQSRTFRQFNTTNAMGIKNLSTPYVRDHSSAKNKKLKDVIEATTEDVIIGFDTSIFIIKVMSTNPTLISQYHCQPEIPLFQLGEAVVDYLKPYFTAGMKKAVLTFDGLTNQLKKERAHQDRSAGNEDKANVLNLPKVFDDCSTFF